MLRHKYTGLIFYLMYYELILVDTLWHERLCNVIYLVTLLPYGDGNIFEAVYISFS